LNTVVGLDVGKSSAVAAALNCFPDNPQLYFNRHRRDFVRLNCDRAGAEKLLSLNPKAIVLEPTGNWYSGFWVAIANRYLIELCWVGHADLASRRHAYGFGNKRDDEDAYCLALCYFDPLFTTIHGQKRFLSFDNRVEPLKDAYFQLKQLDKLRNAAINHLHQRLSLEFPEAPKTIKPSPKLGFSPFIGWLAGAYSYTRVENVYDRSVAHQLGKNISTYTKDHAKLIMTIELRMHSIDRQLQITLNSIIFGKYIKVFREFGFSDRTMALILSKVYPIEKFLLDGKPWIDYEQTSTGKLQRRYRSLRSFQLYLGTGYAWVQSGDKRVWTLSGSSLIRSHLWVWCLVTICPEPPRRLKTEVGRILGDKYDRLRRKGESPINGTDAIVRTLFVTTRLLFKMLIENN